MNLLDFRFYVISSILHSFSFCCCSARIYLSFVCSFLSVPRSSIEPSGQTARQPARYWQSIIASRQTILHFLSPLCALAPLLFLRLLLLCERRRRHHRAVAIMELRITKTEEAHQNRQRHGNGQRSFPFRIRK